MIGKLPYNFIENSPIGKDLFEGKSQEKIADVLSEILTKENFQIIGIDGGWGTGKSNLVQITKEKLTKSKYHFFIYDVWGHQEDDQRKSILVELTEFISEENIIKNRTKWNAKLKKLLSKEKEVTTINIPYLSIGFIFSLFSIIYIPTVNSFKGDMTVFLGIEKLIWKLVLILFPICIVVGIYLYYLIQSWFNKKGFFYSFKRAAQHTFQIYNNKQREETKVETLIENDPSVKDFRSWMKEIDTDLNEDKLVIVFDNFDRLPKKHILSIWSSIHIFFSEDKYKKIKVIIPFDRLHIKNAFKELNGEDNDNKKLDYADDYINKTFDLVYRVSPPILSDWKNFFREYWKKAYPDFNEEEYLKVEQCYEVFKDSITPREIIAFINETVSIKLLDNTIPDRYIALFVLNKDNILSNPLKAITNPEFLSGLSYLYHDNEDFQRFITALSYQINPANALELVYRKQLKDVLINKKIEDFKDISKTTIFNKIIMSTILELNNLENPIIVLNEIDSESKLTVAEKQTLWDDIYLRMKDEKIEDNIVKEYHKKILVNINPIYRIKWLEKLINYDIPNDLFFDSVSYCNLIDDLQRICEERNFNINIFRLIKEFNIDPLQFVSLVKDRKNGYSKYKLTITEDALNLYLKNNTNDKIDQLDYLTELKDDFNLSPFIENLREKIKDNISDYKYLEIAYDVLQKISKNKIGIDMDDSDIDTIFSALNTDSSLYFNVLAMRLARANNFSSLFKHRFNEALQDENENIINEVAERIQLFIDYDDFLINSIDFPDSNLYKEVVKRLVKNEYELSKRVNFKNLFKNFDKICVVNELDPQDLLTSLDGYESTDISIEVLNNFSTSLFEQCTKSNSSLAKACIELQHDIFNGYNKEQWLNIFKGLDEKKLKVLEIIGYHNWNSFSLEALKESLTLKIKNGDFQSNEQLTPVLESFENEGIDLSSTFKDVRDEFINSRNITAAAFIFFEKWMFKYSFFEEKTDDVFRTILKVDLLDNLKCAEIFKQHSTIIKQMMANNPKGSVNDFKSGIRDRMNKDIIKELAKELGIRNAIKDVKK